MLTILTSLLINSTGYTELCTTKAYNGVPNYNTTECLTVKDAYRTRYEKREQALFMLNQDSSGLIEVFVNEQPNGTVLTSDVMDYVFDPCYGMGAEC